MESVNVRIAELSKIITESLKNSSVESAAIWAMAIKERSRLQEELNRLTK